MPPDALKRASIHTLGCRLNQAESSLLAERLQEAGYTMVPFGAPADLGVVNTCTVTAEADAKSRKMIRAFIRANPGAFVVVTGCYAQLAHEAVAAIPGVDLVLGTREKLDLLDYIAARKNPVPAIICGALDGADFAIPTSSRSAMTRRANLKIQDGCDAGCAYCIVPAARGPARSRVMDNLIEEARGLVQRGVKEIVITGLNVGAYRYRGQTVLDVVDRLNEIPGLRRIRISSIELNAVPEALFDRMNDPAHALAPFLHVPVQSGSNRVLARMKRHYTAETALAFLRKAAATVDDLGIGADILVGFPGETEDDSDATCRLLAESPLAYAHVFKYSPRKGTPAERMDGNVDAAVLHGRSARVRGISEEKRRQFHQRFLGRTLDVLLEQQERGQWRGYTGNYIRVAICSSDDLENVLRPVRLETDCGEIVTGRLVL
jgi:threonylcarbamoyladenosine tRNA methylthiotransferase MtaB